MLLLTRRTIAYMLKVGVFYVPILLVPLQELFLALLLCTAIQAMNPEFV